MFDHWMFIAAKSSASQAPGSPAIAPTDPPRFARCIRQTRRRIPGRDRTSTRVIRKECRQLFKALSRQVLDFLIRDKWHEIRAAADGIVVTPAQVRKEFESDKRAQFPTDRQFRRFLRSSGQTVPDVMFRVRATMVYKALLGQENLAPHALDAEVKRMFKSQTKCALYYVMDDCSRR